MSEDLVFMMGKYEARFPRDRLYARNHMWGKVLGETLRFGLSAYAVRLLQDVFFLEWSVDPQSPVRERQQIGGIESSKAESDLYAPIAGTLREFNEALLVDPSGINASPYEEGWLFALSGVKQEALMSAEEYLIHLQASWEIAQRTIKGQMNE